MEEPSVSLTTTLSRQVLPVLVTSIVYVTSSPTLATRSTPLARVASSADRKRYRRQGEIKKPVFFGYGRTCMHWFGTPSEMTLAVCSVQNQPTLGCHACTVDATAAVGRGCHRWRNTCSRGTLRYTTDIIKLQPTVPVRSGMPTSGSIRSKIRSEYLGHPYTTVAYLARGATQNNTGRTTVH